MGFSCSSLNGEPAFTKHTLNDDELLAVKLICCTKFSTECFLPFRQFSELLANFSFSNGYIRISSQQCPVVTTQNLLIMVVPITKYVLKYTSFFLDFLFSSAILLFVYICMRDFNTKFLYKIVPV